MSAPPDEPVKRPGGLPDQDGAHRKQPGAQQERPGGQQERPGGHRERLLAAAMICLRDKGYAHTTARDLVAVSGTNLKSIGYHFGGKEALLDEAIANVFKLWVSRVEEAVSSASSFSSPRDLLERVLSILIDVFEEQRPLLVSCVEALAPAIRSATLRARMAAAYAETRQIGADMVRRACADLGVEPPFAPEIFVSVLSAIVDGLMLQWLCDPDATPDARQVVDALAGLSVLAAER